MTETAPRRLAEVLDLLRANGGRITSPRRAILQALIDHDEHVTAEQLTATVQRRHPDVAESTVYRFLDDLERLGVVDHVHLGHGPAVYHFRDKVHHHLVCERCGAVAEVPASDFAAVLRKIQRDYRFEIDLRHFAIPGYCGKCASESD